MKLSKRGLSLRMQYLLLFWGTTCLFLFLMFYYPLKKFSYPVKSELKIPEEHRHFIATIWKYEQKYEGVFKKEENERLIDYNPFYEEKSNAEKKPNVPGEPPIRLPVLPVDFTGIPAGIPVENVLMISATFNGDGEEKGCIINGKFYREGEKIGNVKIARIGDYYVVLLLPKGKKVKLEVGVPFNPFTNH